MERGPAAFDFEARVVAAIIIQPQRKKNHRHEQTVNDRAGGEIEHGNNLH